MEWLVAHAATPSVHTACSGCRLCGLERSCGGPQWSALSQGEEGQASDHKAQPQPEPRRERTEIPTRWRITVPTPPREAWCAVRHGWWGLPDCAGNDLGDQKSTRAG